MNCPKCGGRMNFEEFFSSATEGTSWAYEGWRCIYCGEIIDPLILLNRKGTVNRKTVSMGKERSG
ncbi:MAG TPA: hypothetical protein VLY20_01360 [Nitrospiria bacterium]|nr:hypothetical protein [Nitrospiria bacterium]